MIGGRWCKALIASSNGSPSETGINVNHNAVDAIKFPAQNGESILFASAQTHPIPGPGTRFQHDASGISIRIHQKYDFPLHIRPFVRQR